MAKLSKGDMVATEAVYHQCLVTLYNAQRSYRIKESQTENQGSHIYGIVLSEKITYIRNEYETSEVSPVFKLRDLKNCFANVWSTTVTSQ